ncbi:hypothetical protein [Yoonia sp.]|uniref:hypothetical protein n=1 Tax=Yoonia sp. TaxID=2212373 RepID=UPI003919CDFF
MKIIGTITLLAAGCACGMAQAECADFVLRAHITEPDHFSSTGTRITEAGGILQQNVYNVNSGRHIDSFDSAGPNLQSHDARAAFSEAARSHLNQAQKALIEDISQENVITIGVNGCVNFESRSAAYTITHLNFSEVTGKAYAAPFMPATDDESMWSAHNSELLSTHFHKSITAEDFRIAYLASPEAKLMMLNHEFFCGTLGCSAVLLDAQDELVWEGEIADGRVHVAVEQDGNIINIYNTQDQLSQINMSD